MTGYEARGRRRTRGSVSATLAAVLVASALGTTAGAPPAGAAEPDLLSQGKPVRVSAVENNDPELVAKHAVDGSMATRWASHHEDPSWIWVDLQATADVSRIRIDWEDAYSTSYTIGVSQDAASWTTIATVDPADGGTDVLDVSGRGRYVRMLGTTRNGIAGHSLWEFQVFGSVVPDKPKKSEPTEEPEKEPEQEQQAAPPPQAEAPEPPEPTETERPIPDRDGPPGSVVYYVVGKQDGEVEKIEDIADRLLGDAERWPEIVELSQGHRQPTASSSPTPTSSGRAGRCNCRRTRTARG